MKHIFIGIGSNLRNPKRQVLDAINFIANITNINILKKSSLYKTAPVGFVNQPHFINAVISIEFNESPDVLLKYLLEIEKKFGRIRKEKNGPRTLDLDILLFKNMHITKNNLIVPHPRMHERLFVLLPLSEIDPDIEIKPHGLIKKLIAKAPKDIVEKIES